MLAGWQPTRPCHLVALPAEMLLSVSDYLDSGHLAALARSSKSLYALLNPLLYRKTARGPLAESALKDAIMHGFENNVRMLLAGGMDPNLHALDGTAALHLCAVYGRTSLCELLLDHHASPTLKIMRANQPWGFAEGAQPVHYAAAYGRKEIVELFRRRGVDVLARDASGWGGLEYAIYSGQTEVVQLFLGYGASFNAVDDSGNQPITIGAMKGFADIVGLLVDAGADITSHSDNLCAAAAFGRVDVVQLLLACGASVNTCSSDHVDSPFDVAVRQDQEKIVRLFLELDDLDPDIDLHSTLIRSVQELRVGTVRALVDHDDELLFEADAHGWTALHFACKLWPRRERLSINDAECQMEIVETLLDAGAHIDAQTISGFTPLHVAASNGAIDIAKILCEAGAELEASDATKKTALHHAMGQGQHALATILLQYKDGFSCAHHGPIGENGIL